MAISGDIYGDGRGHLGRHAFGPALILLFTTVVAFPNLYVFGLFLLPR
jgi:hypothetical protein